MNTISEKQIVAKWNFKMDFCKKNGLPPAQPFAWDIAEKAYEKHCMTQEKRE